MQIFPVVILDTNIWLDILLFNDVRTRPIHAALVSGAVTARIDLSCYAELAHVLHYTQLRHLIVDREQTLAWVREHSQFFQEEVESNLPPLPVCRDPDDQKFLELAYKSRAEFLISKDKALLKVAVRMQRQFNIMVLLPELFCSQYLCADGFNCA